MCSTKNNITVHIFGTRYDVPPNITLLRAMEYAGLVPIHECGCRGGFCGTCTVAVRKSRHSKAQVVLACRTTVHDGMYIEHLSKSEHVNGRCDIHDIRADTDCIMQMHPEIDMCISCGQCTKLCPNDIDVMQCINHIKNGEIVKCAKISLGCIMCGICSLRCPVGIKHAQAMLTARRLNGKFLVPVCEQLEKRISEIHTGMYSDDIAKLLTVPDEEIKELYNMREIEK